MIRSGKRAASAVLTAVVLLGAPGLRAYAAAAEIVASPGVSAASAAGVSAAAVSSAFSGAAALVPAVPVLRASAPSLAGASAAAFPSAGVFAPGGSAAAAVALPAASAPMGFAAPSADPTGAADAGVAASPASAVSVGFSGRTAEDAVSAALRIVGERSSRAGSAPASPDDRAVEGAWLFDLSARRPNAALPVFAAAAAAQDGDAPGGNAGGLSPASAAAPAAAPATPPAPKSGRTKLPRSLWGLFWGHHILTVTGIELHVVSQPFLVMETLKKSKAIMGLVRNVHMGSMSLVNLLPVGLLIDKTDFRVLFIGTSLARAALMGSIPLLFLAGHLSFGMLVGIIALNPLFQSTMIVADGAARMSFLGNDEKLNKEASATLGKWDSLAGMITPIAASLVVAGLVGSYGLGGYALAYGVYAAFLLMAVPIYWIMVRDTRDHSEMGMAGFLSFLKGTATFLWAFAKGILLSPFALARFLYGLIKSGGAGAATEPGLGLKERVARTFDAHEATQGFSYILRNKTLSTLISVGAIEAFLSDAMPMVVLPNFIKDVVGVGPHFAFPLVGGLLATAGGLFGVMLAAESVGRFLSSWRMEGEKGDKLIAKLGHGRFYKMAAVSSLLFWLLWAVPTFAAPHMFWAAFGTVMFVQFATQFFHGPVGIVMAPIVRREIPDARLGRVESAFNMVDMFFSAGGALVAGFLLDWFGISTAMGIIAGAITFTGVVEWLVPAWLFPDGVRPAPKPAEPEASKGGAGHASAAPRFALAFA
jgi:hypothetical protein